MKIQVDGTNTVNKGAELMLYSILQQIEKQYPKAEVFFNDNYRTAKSNYILTSLNFHKRTWLKIGDALRKFRIEGIFKRLRLPFEFLSLNYAPKEVDIVLDASGFQYSDSFIINDKILKEKENYYSYLKRNGIKLVFLPQAFGPFNKKIGGQTVKLLNKYVDLIFARDDISYNHLVSNGFNKKKLLLFPDFTALYEVNHEPVGDDNREVCIIPNYRMVDKGGLDQKSYINFLIDLITRIKEFGFPVKLLNHESNADYMLCLDINKHLESPVKIYSGLSAIEVKQEIAKSFLVISSRFHGVASALNSGLPCLATSWSHKYEKLFENYNQFDNLLNFNDLESSWAKTKIFLDLKRNRDIRQTVLLAKSKVISQNKEMWHIIWNMVERSESI